MEREDSGGYYYPPTTASTAAAAAAADRDGVSRDGDDAMMGWDIDASVLSLGLGSAGPSPQAQLLRLTALGAPPLPPDFGGCV